jgi:hypothetical protein
MAIDWEPPYYSSKSKPTIFEKCIYMLCELSWTTQNKYYIPGETNEVERMRGEAIEKGIIITLRFVYEHCIAKVIKDYIYKKVLQFITLADYLI